MIVHIHDNLSIADLQERFSKCFPSLKIEFYSKPHSIKKPPKENWLISPEKRVANVRHNHNEGELEIKSWYTVRRIENDFREKFGLNAQIFRNENGEWIQTNKTDKFSLHAQQEMVRHATSSIYPKHQEQLREYDEL
jgi:hypothetical protein